MPSYLNYISATTVVMIGWYVVHGLNIKRDKSNKRDEMILQYLLEAYRRLESAACRENSCEDLKRGFESAIADIQLLGSSKQISQVKKFAHLYISENDATVNDLMRDLRDELRLQLGLEKVGSKPVIFRFTPEINVVSAMTCDENQ